jgi:DNA repair protein SbcC/Rad50
MIPKRVLLENFLSFGQPAVEIEFSDNEPLWVICGPNGVGKSAIFDAVTYALFASHRGGVKNAEQLIRHGANSFRVEFDFELNERDYRITRTKAARTTQRVYSRVPGTDEWEPEPIGNAAPDVKRWVEKHIGLEFEAFKASVLLRQGEADAILTATGAERLALLKTVIGADRFEFISDRIHEDLKEHKDELDRLRQTLDDTQPVSEEEINTARDALAQADSRRKEALERSGRASEILAGAKQWHILLARKSSLETAIKEANERAGQANRIRADKIRLEMLTMVVPKLKTIRELRVRIQQTESKIAALVRQEGESKCRREAIQAEVATVTNAHETHRAQAEQHAQIAHRLRDEIVRDSKSLSVAEEIFKLSAELSAFPADLTQSLTAAEGALAAALIANQQAGERKAATMELLKQAETREVQFAKVGVGVPCSICGQVVDKAHAEKEKAALAIQVSELRKKLQVDEQSAKDAMSLKHDCERKRSDLLQVEQQRNVIAAKLSSLHKLGISSDPSSIRKQLEEKERAASNHEQHYDEETKKQKAAATEKVRLDHQCRQLDESNAHLTGRIRTLETSNAGDVSQRNTLFEQLPADWQIQSATLDAKAIDELEAEKRRLDGLGIFDLFEKLQHDTARLQEWTKQLGETAREMEGVAVESRLPVDEVECRNRSIADEVISAESARDEAKTRMDDLNRHISNQRELADVVRTAEQKLDLQKKLDDLLGKKGLQRELVRAAERDIVAYAKDTLDKLSDGDLTLELAEGEDADTAFDLRVRRAEDPIPIGVSFLSGSQKFRVAVSIALAIGRFASGQARPLESVIIDEGFGSLDREGLRAMADELNRLRTFLKRIVLVSHQEEFADRFPVGIRLNASAHGTVAEPFRR